MQDTQSIIALIKRNAEKVNGDIIKQVIKDEETEHNRRFKLYMQYKQSEDYVAIFQRTFDDKNKVNRELPNDFFGDIVDTKVGYLAGKPITYQLDKNPYMTETQLDEAKYEKDMTVINDFLKYNSIADIDSEIFKYNAICGIGGRLLYVDAEGRAKIMNLKPWEVIFIFDRAIDDLQYAVRYYDITVYESDGTSYTGKRVEWYDKDSITFWLETKNKDYMLDPTEGLNPKPHLFNKVPIFAYPNNTEYLSDVEKVLRLIDGYDRTLSDINSEIEQFRLAYLGMYGYSQPDQETMDKIKKTGAFGIDKDGKIEFITKDLNDAAIEHHLDRLQQSIYYLSKSVNFNDQQFAGNQSGVAMKFKVFGLESKSIVAERKFQRATGGMFNLLTEMWKEKGMADVNPLDITMQFTRNFPLNLGDEADSTMKFKGMVSDKTRLSLLSFIEDADKELKQMELEQEGSIDLDEVGEESEEEIEE